MPAQHEEEIGIALECVEDGAALGGEAGRRPAVEQIVGHEDRTPVAVHLYDGVGPLQHRVRGARHAVVHLDEHGDELHAAGFEERVVVVEVARTVAAAIAGLHRLARGEPGVELRRAGRRAIVVAGDQPIRDAAGCQDVIGRDGTIPLCRIRADIDVVAQAGGINDVARRLVVHDPLHLRVVDGRVGGRVVLRVGDGDEREVRRRRRVLDAAVEGDRHLVGFGVCYVDREGRRLGNAPGTIGRRDEAWRVRRRVAQVEGRTGDPGVTAVRDRAGNAGAG